MKKSLLVELYNGNLAPADKGYLNNPEVLQLMNIAADSEDKLSGMLEGEAKDLFDSYSEALDQIQANTNLDRFIDGFCIGMKLAIGVLSDDE